MRKMCHALMTNVRILWKRFGHCKEIESINFMSVDNTHITGFNVDLHHLEASNGNEVNG